MGEASLASRSIALQRFRKIAPHVYQSSADVAKSFSVRAYGKVCFLFDLMRDRAVENPLGADLGQSMCCRPKLLRRSEMFIECEPNAPSRSSDGRRWDVAGNNSLPLRPSELRQIPGDRNYKHFTPRGVLQPRACALFKTEWIFTSHGLCGSGWYNSRQRTYNKGVPWLYRSNRSNRSYAARSNDLGNYYWLGDSCSTQH